MQLRIRVGASADRSLGVAFRPLVDAAEKAKTQIDQMGKRQGTSYAAATKTGTDAAEREFAKLAKSADKWQKQMVRDAERAIKQRERLEEAAASKALRESERVARGKERDAARAASAETRAADRAASAQAAAAKRAASAQARAVQRADRDSARRQAKTIAADGRESRAFGRQVGNAASMAGGMVLGAGRAAAGLGLGVARDIATSSGVETDLGAIFGQNVSLESRATNISNSGYMRGDARNGKRVDPRELMDQAINTGRETGTNGNDALAGLEKFTAKTGDLQTGRDILKDMSILAKATGTSLEDMINAAGDVSTALGDVPNKAEKIHHVMTAVAGQGKLGAVEIKDFASQMAKIASAAGQFEGDTGKNILTLSAMAQESRQRGGSASATQAATSVASFVSMLKTPKRAEEFEKATGTKVFNKQTGMLRDPRHIIEEAIAAKGMDPLAFKKIFQNNQGARAVEGFATIYRQNGGGEAGMKAVAAEFERLEKAAMDDVEVMDSFRAAMRTTESQANVFNNAIRQSALEAQGVLIPAMAELAPAMIGLAQSAASATRWLVGRDATVRQENAVVGGRVDRDVTEMQKQVSRGYITQDALDEGQEAEKRAFWASNSSRAEAVVSGQDRANSFSNSSFARGAITASDFINPASLIFGRQGAKSIQQGEAQQELRDQAAIDASMKLDEIQKTNQQVRDLLSQGIIVKRVIEGPRAATSPPELGPGRTPPPGD